MQDIIDTEFKDTTVLAVMHRLNHVKKYDRVAVLDQGRLVEYGEPGRLTVQESCFAKLLDFSF